MKILIAEDDFISRSMLKKMLIEIGYQVVETENGKQAWDFIQNNKIQIIITDWMMPEMDGLKLCQTIREASFENYIYIIMLTAKDRKTDLVEVFQAGADDYIPKPFDPEELRARVLTGKRILDLEEQHKIMQSTLLESRNKLRIVFDSLQEEIVAFDRKFNIVSANLSFAKHCGDVKVDELIGKNCTQINSQECRQLFDSKFKPFIIKVFERGDVIDFLNEDEDDQGLKTYKQVAFLPVKDEYDEIIQTVVVSKDITEDRRKSEEIKCLNKRLLESSAQIEAKNKTLENTLKQLEETQTQMLQSEKMASIGQLAAGVAHEINNPTGFVSSNLKTLSDYQKDINQLINHYRKLIATLNASEVKQGFTNDLMDTIEKLKDYENEIDIEFLIEDISDLIEDCREGTDRIKKIVIDLKDFAHPGEDKIQSVDVNDGIKSTLNVVNNELKYKASVHQEFGEIPTVRGFPQQLNQVFMNILVNAAQSIEKKGDITIQTIAKDGHVQIKISDTGCGIAKENIPKIFDPFFTTKDVGKGTGLGMNIAYNIVQKHNGTIDVQSDVGKGTTFIIEIPAEA